jgi:two-component system NtrC family sensor kinase
MNMEWLHEVDVDSVLIVDDNHDDTELVTQVILEEFPGCRVEDARTAEEGLAKAAKPKWSLILLDLKLPLKSGLQVLPEIRQLAPDSGIIMLTGHGDERIAVQAMRAGADYYLAKSKDFFMALPLVIREVLEKRYLRYTLMHTEDRYRLLIENMMDVIYELDEEGRFRFVSLAVTDLLGYTPREMIGMHYSRVLHPDDRRTFGRRFHERRTGHRAARRMEIRLVAKTGEARTFEVSASGVYDQRRRFHATAGIARDVTDRKRIAESLRATETLLHAIMETVPDAIFAKDREGRYLLANPAALRVLSPAEPTTGKVIGKTDAELVNRKTAEEFMRSDRLLFETGKPVRRREQETTPLGARTWDAVKVPYKDARGQVQGLIGVSRDVTEQLRLEEQMRHAEKLRALGQFVAGVAHELNNPLTGILGYAELALPHVHDPQVRESLEVVCAQSRRAAKIVENILAFARPQSPRRSPVSIPELVKTVLKAEEGKLAAAAITVACEWAEDLQPALADRGQLEQVLAGLITNARQAMAAAHGRGRLRIGARLCGGEKGACPLFSPDPAEEKEWVDLEVADDGPGIPAEHREKIFTPFFTTKPVGEGTGLGLSIVYAIIREHGGAIEVRDAQGGGASFVIHLPAARPQEAAEPAQAAASPAPAPQAQAPSAGAAGPLVFVVEDEEMIRKFLTILLTGEGYSVAAYGRATEALALLMNAEMDPRLIFLDVKMPEMDGPEFFSKLAAFNPAFAKRVIFCTGDVLSPETQAVIAQHGSAALAKPFDRSKLRAAIADAMARINE